MMMASQSAGWVYVCIKSTARNTGTRKQTESEAASVGIPAHWQSTAGPCTSLQGTVQGCLTYRQGTAKHGKRKLLSVWCAECLRPLIWQYQRQCQHIFN